MPTSADPESFCFGCNPDHPSGFHLVIEVEGTRAWSDFRPTHLHQGPPGLTHGGLIGAALDDVMARLVRDAAVGRHFTGTLTVRYRRPVPIGQTHRLEASVVRTEPRKVFVEGRLVLPDGAVGAEAEGVWVRPAGT